MSDYSIFLRSTNNILGLSGFYNTKLVGISLFFITVDSLLIQSVYTYLVRSMNDFSILEDHPHMGEKIFTIMKKCQITFLRFLAMAPGVGGCPRGCRLRGRSAAASLPGGVR